MTAGVKDVKEPLHLRKERKTANSIGGRSGRQQLRLESMRNGNDIFGKSIGLEFVKRAAGRKQCDEFAQSIARQQLSKDVPIHNSGSCFLSRRILHMVARQQSVRQSTGWMAITW
jgi:hypothetical protein